MIASMFCKVGRRNYKNSMYVSCKHEEKSTFLSYKKEIAFRERIILLSNGTFEFKSQVYNLLNN